MIKLFKRIAIGMIVGGMLGIPMISAAQNGAAVATSLATPAMMVGQEVSVDILLNLNGNPSLGGYIDLTYDPAVFECVVAENLDLFGKTDGKLESCANTGLLRIASMPPSISDTTSFTRPQRYATITLRAVQPAETTAIQFAGSSQIFGTAGGDILTQRDDSATHNIQVQAQPQPEATATPPGVPGQITPGPGEVAVPEPSMFLLFIVGLGGLFWIWRKQR